MGDGDRESSYQEVLDVFDNKFLQPLIVISTR